LSIGTGRSEKIVDEEVDVVMGRVIWFWSDDRGREGADTGASKRQ